MRAALACMLILAAPAAPSPSVVLAARLNGTTALADIQLGWSVADFIARHASKEETESLGPDARGFRRFRVLPSARPSDLDDVVVYFRENRLILIGVVQTRPADDVGSWSQLVAGVGGKLVAVENQASDPLFGRYTTSNDRADAVSPERATMLTTFALGERAKSLKLRERAGWSARGGEVGAFWLEDSWKKRTYVLTLARTSDAGQPELTALFAAEKAFFGEWNTYSTDLLSLGYQPESGGNWVYGFCSASPDFEIPGLDGHDPARNHTMHADFKGTKEADRERLKPLADPCAKLEELGLADKFVLTPQAFRAFAIANTDADADVEVWSIDQNKNLERIRSDSE